MRPIQKRGFFNFIFSLMPGASEMNMGFMKAGLSIMGAFLGSFMVMALLGLSDIFMVLPVILWFYAFFHARNLACCDPQTFMELEDDYFWNDFIDDRSTSLRSDNVRKWGSWILVIAGVMMLWNIVFNPVIDFLQGLMYDTGYFIYHVAYGFLSAVPRFVAALVILYFGFRMILGKKNEVFRITDSPIGSRKADYGTVVTNTNANTTYNSPFTVAKTEESKEEPKEVVNEATKEGSKEEPKDVIKDELKEATKEDSKVELKFESKVGETEEAKEASKEEPKEELKAVEVDEEPVEKDA